MKRTIFFWLSILFSFSSYSQSSKELYEAGLELKKEKKTKEALQKFLEAEKLSAANANAIYESAWCYNDLGSYSNAIVQLVKIRSEYANIAKYYFEKGYAYYKLEKVDSANTAFKRCLEIKPDYSNVEKYQGYNAYMVDNYTKALEYFSEHLLKVKAKNKEETDYLFWYRKGFSENALKNYEEAVRSLQKSMEIKNDYNNTYLELGFACTKLKQSPQAIYYFKEAKKIDPKSHIPTNGIGEVYRDNYKNMDSAMYWYSETLKIKFRERKASFGMGYCLNTKSRYAEAMTYLQIAVEEEPTYTAAYVELGYAQFKTGKNDVALVNFDKALSLSSKNENARFYKGLLFIATKDKAKAQQMADELKSLNSKNATLLQDKVNKM